MAGNLTAMIAAAFSGSAAPPVTSDPYFDYTTLLLPGNGTNGAQNNTFLDSSTNNFTITRNGNTTQGTFSPFSQTGWGNYFNGSSYLSAAYNSAFDLGASDFTIEAWIFTGDSSSNYPSIIGRWQGSGTACWDFRPRSTDVGNYLTFVYSTNGSNNTAINSNFVVTDNTWHHVVAVRSGNNFALFVDGSRKATANFSGVTIFNSASAPLYVGYDPFGATYYTGYISNARLVNGRAVYDPTLTTLTVPTSPLGATSGGANPPTTGQTKLLTCQSNRFVDNGQGNTSNTPFTLTVTGSPSVQAFSPFNPSASWSAATYGGSGYFDGSGDYLTGPSNAAFDFSTGTFSVEFWVFPSDLAFRIYLSAPNNASTQIGYDPGNGPRYLYFYSSSIVFSGQIGTFAANQWNHIVLCRSGTTLSMFCNGARVYTNASYSSSINFSTPYVGEYHAIGLPTLGYMSNLRFVKGSTPYDPTSSTITVPTAPLTNITNTSLLLNYTNAGIYDATSKNDLETVDGAKISTAISAKWGSGSMAFDGNDEAIVPASPLLVLGTSPFTIEMWIYASNAASGSTQELIGNLTNSAGVSNFSLQLTPTGVLQFGVYDAILANSGASVVSSSSWTHVAASYDGTTYRVFINGNVGSTTSTTQRNISDATNRIKIANTNFGSRYFTGYMQDVRITRGYARYTSNFTPPTAAFPTL